MSGRGKGGGQKARAPKLTDQARKDAEASIGHTFKNPELLDRALTHRSATPGKAAAWSNERLEFLGDRVLGLVIAETLLERFPDVREGEIAPRLNRLVSRDTCALAGEALGLGDFLMTDGSDKANGTTVQSSLLSNAVEAVIGAIHMDGGMTASRKFVLRTWKPYLSGVKQTPQDPKSKLQERVQGEGGPPPRYEASDRKGPDHAPVFTVKVHVQGRKPASGEGPSKQDAERAAAKAMLAMMKDAQ